MLLKGAEPDFAKRESQEFWDFYESKGWKIGKDPMVRWKSSASRWIRANKRHGVQNGKPSPDDILTATCMWDRIGKHCQSKRRVKMEPNDRQKFREQFTVAMSTVYGKEMSVPMLEVFWRALQSYSIHEVTGALNRHIQDTDRGQFAPKPADLIRQIEGDQDGQAMQAWSQVRNAVGRIGTYESVVFDDPIIHAVIDEMGGWIRFGMFTEEEEPFRGQEFAKRYRAHKMRCTVPQHPPVLTGRAEMDNRNIGLLEHVPAPVHVGPNGRRKEKLLTQRKEELDAPKDDL